MTRALTRLWSAALVLTLVLAAACGGKKSGVPPNTSNPDRYLFDRGNEAIKDGKWLNAREYYRQVVDNYPQSPVRPDAKLGVGDSFLGEKSAESLVLAANEYREFLTFYPRHERADYAQYKLAMSHFMQMRAPERDQTETVSALKEFQAFFDRYPNSTLTPEVRTKWREARDRLSRAEFRVGFHYFRVRWCPGAIPRFRACSRTTPSSAGATKCISIWRNASPEPIRNLRQSLCSNACWRNSARANTQRMHGNASMN